MPGEPAAFLFPFLGIFNVLIITMAGISIEEHPGKTFVERIALRRGTPFAGGIKAGRQTIAGQPRVVIGLAPGVFDAQAIVNGQMHRIVKEWVCPAGEKDGAVRIEFAGQVEHLPVIVGHGPALPIGEIGAERVGSRTKIGKPLWFMGGEKDWPGQLAGAELADRTVQADLEMIGTRGQKAGEINGKGNILRHPILGQVHFLVVKPYVNSVSLGPSLSLRPSSIQAKNEPDACAILFLFQPGAGIKSHVEIVESCRIEKGLPQGRRPVNRHPARVVRSNRSGGRLIEILPSPPRIDLKGIWPHLPVKLIQVGHRHLIPTRKMVGIAVPAGAQIGQRQMAFVPQPAAPAFLPRVRIIPNARGGVTVEIIFLAGSAGIKLPPAQGRRGAVPLHGLLEEAQPHLHAFV